ncbi:MAG: hypothetical protein JWQ88_1151 [Rhodoferax sp.]|nr:hypothetical protein [Rhodoferax sp.]
MKARGLRIAVILAVALTTLFAMVAARDSTIAMLTVLGGGLIAMGWLIDLLFKSGRANRKR